MTDPNGMIQGSNGVPIELVDAKARSELPKKLARPETAQVGDYLRIKSIGEDGTMEVEAVPAPTTEIPADPNFSTVTLGGDSGVVMAPGGAADAPVLALRGAQGEASVRLSNVADATDDRDAPNLGQIKALMQQLEVVKLAVVASLPEAGDEKTLYLVPAANEGDLYAEYLYINGAWEIVGSQRLDLTGYATESYVDAVPAVRYAEQTLTEEQQMQARANMGLYNKRMVQTKTEVYTHFFVGWWESEGTLTTIGAGQAYLISTPTGDYACKGYAYLNNYDIGYGYIGDASLIPNGNLSSMTVDTSASVDCGFVLYQERGCGDESINVVVDPNMSANMEDRYTVYETGEMVEVVERITEEYLPDEVLMDYELSGAIDTALAQAQKRGEFDGADGKGILSITRTSGDGSPGTVDTYTITYTDGTTGTYTVYNGKDGDKGDPGDAATLEITEVTALAYGAAPTVTEVEGSTAQARKLILGIPAGKSGDSYTLTDDDRTEIARLVIEDLGGQPVSGYIDEDNNIVITSDNLADGTYAIAYKRADGTLAGTGSLTVGTQSEPESGYTNILTSGDYEIQLNKRWSNSAKGYTDCDGMIAFLIPIADVWGKTIRFTGFPANTTAGTSNSPIWITINSSNERVLILSSSDTTGNVWKSDNLVDEGNDVYSVAVGDATFVSAGSGTSEYLAINMAFGSTPITAIPDDAIMTIDEEIV